MKINTVNIVQLSQEKTLRNDCIYQRMASKRNSQNGEFYSFKELFDAKEEKIAASDIVGCFRYCQIGDVDKGGTPHPVTLDFDIRDLTDEDYYKKIEKGDAMRVKENDILMSFLLPQDVSILGKFTRIGPEESDILFSTAFLRLVAHKYPEVLYYCLQSVFYEDLVSTARIRKGYTGYATLSKDDLLDLKFPRKTIDAIAANYGTLKRKISDIENQIANKQKAINSDASIIDFVFQREFGFDYDKFETLKSQKYYFTQQSMFSNNPDLRFSVKYHRPAGDFVMEELTRISDKKIKHFISEPIVLGASISPSDFDESGEAYYVSMATIKTLEVVLDETQLVSSSYFEAKKAKSLQRNDIVVARSGVAIGKTAIVRDDFDGIFADFTMRIRFDEAKYNPQFAYYYLRSKYFQYLIEVYKKGLQNQNIFPIVMQEFPIPDISLPEQQRIVDEIQAEIENQEQLKAEIASLRNQIDEVIIQSISA
jgi:type I restriction enzyme, S subunit